jgi:hypothetical protein
MRRLAALLVLLLFAPATRALVVESEPDDANIQAPSPDPGWANLGRHEGKAAIYLGNGWVITALHLGAGDVVFGAINHRALPESIRRLGRGDGPPDADLVVFRIEPHPDLPELPIRPTPPGVGDRALLIGSGSNRGEPLTWNGRKGWTWGPVSRPRWGTNLVSAVGLEVRTGDSVTPGFAMSFDARGTRFEAQAATGDSGGAVFIPREGRFELAGILLATASFPGQPPNTALYGNLSTAADLSVFRDALAALVHPR